jgi:hypothetical protein
MSFVAAVVVGFATECEVTQQLVEREEWEVLFIGQTGIVESFGAVIMTITIGICLGRI